MSGNRSHRWQQLDQSRELLFFDLVAANSRTARLAGPIVESLAKKVAELLRRRMNGILTLSCSYRTARKRVISVKYCE
jgi:hypothetical protein